MYPQGRPVWPRLNLTFRYLNPILTKGGRFCPPLQRSQLNIFHGYVPEHSITSYSILVYQRFHEIDVWTFKRFKENMYWDTYRTVDGFLFGLLKSKLRLIFSRLSIPMIWKNWECNCTSCTQASTTSVIQYILLAFYYKYRTYRCLTPNFFDCTELINVKPIFFHHIFDFSWNRNIFWGVVRYLKLKIEYKIPNSTYIIEQYV